MELWRTCIKLITSNKNVENKNKNQVWLVIKMHSWLRNRASMLVCSCLILPVRSKVRIMQDYVHGGILRDLSNWFLSWVQPWLDYEINKVHCQPCVQMERNILQQVARLQSILCLNYVQAKQENLTQVTTPNIYLEPTLHVLMISWSLSHG